MQQDAKAQEAFLRKEMNKTTLDINSQLAEERRLAEQQVGANAASHGNIGKEATFPPFDPLQKHLEKEVDLWLTLQLGPDATSMIEA